MTDDNQEGELWQVLQNLPADDAIPRPELTAEDYLHMDRMVGRTNITLTEPGVVIPDVDGNPNYMGPERTWNWAAAAPPIFPPEQLAAVGLTPEDVPNLAVLEINDGRNSE